MRFVLVAWLMVPVLVTGLQTIARWRLRVAYVDLYNLCRTSLCAACLYIITRPDSQFLCTCVYILWFSVAWGSATFWWQSNAWNCSMFCVCTQSGSKGWDRGMLVLPECENTQTNKQTNSCGKLEDQPGVHGLHFRSLQRAELVLYVTLSSDDLCLYVGQCTNSCLKPIT